MESLTLPDKHLLDALEPQEIATVALLEKYAKGDERHIAEVQARVARALASVEAEDQRSAREAEFLWAMQRGFVPAGRIMSAAGTHIRATLLNCFVQPVGDAITGYEGDKPGVCAAFTRSCRDDAPRRVRRLRHQAHFPARGTGQTDAFARRARCRPRAPVTKWPSPLTRAATRFTGRGSWKWRLSGRITVAWPSPRGCRSSPESSIATGRRWTPKR